MENGRIVESGAPQDLLRRDGAFYCLVAQAEATV